MQTPRLFDGHNDVLTRLMEAGGVDAAGGFDNLEGAIDARRAEKGGWAGGFFAIWVPSDMDPIARMDAMDKGSYRLPLPEPIGIEAAREVVETQLAILETLATRGHLTICTDVGSIRDTLSEGGLVAVCHMEGAEAIDTDLAVLGDYHARGLRSLGPVWSRPTAFGHGVPFAFPATPDIGPGLTEAGARLVRECDRLGIMIDLSHLNEAGFWDVARLSDQPLVATHSNAHAVSAHARNLTDRQLDAIAERGGVVGLNFACAFLRDDGRMDADVPFDTIMRHLDHLIGRLGEDGVAIGSDYDGALVPALLTGVSDLPGLRGAMGMHGIDTALMQKIFQDNWLRVLDEIWR